MENSPFKYVLPPFAHQHNEFESTRDYQYFAHFWEMGLGKSKIVLDTAQWLFLSGKITAMVITAEKGYYLNWMFSEFPKHWPEDIPVRIHPYSTPTSARARKAMDAMLTPREGTLDVLLLNIESISSTNFGGFFFANKFVESHKSIMMVVDESTTIKNPKANRTKNAIKLGAKCQYRRILSGTPITQSPIDLYSQCEFLRRGLLGFKSYTSFKNFYSIIQPQYLGSRVIWQVLGYRELDDLAQRIQPFSSRLEKKDCLTLPEKVYTTVHVDPTDDQKRMILKLHQEALALINGKMVTAANALALLTKSLQVAGGHIKDDDGTVGRIESNKPIALKALVESIANDAKIIVWGYFHEDMQIIQETLADVCPVFEMSGRVDQGLRDAALFKFRNHRGKCVFLASPRVAGKSLTLNEATYTIYYSNGFNLEHRLQSEDRNHRIGQEGTVNYYDLVCLATPDIKVVKALREKKILSDKILDQLDEYFVYTKRETLSLI